MVEQNNHMFVKLVGNISARFINSKLTKGPTLERSRTNAHIVTNVLARQELLGVTNFLIIERRGNFHAIFVSRHSQRL